MSINFILKSSTFPLKSSTACLGYHNTCNCFPSQKYWEILVQFEACDDTPIGDIYLDVIFESNLLNGFSRVLKIDEKFNILWSHFLTCAPPAPVVIERRI